MFSNCCMSFVQFFLYLIFYLEFSRKGIKEAETENPQPRNRYLKAAMRMITKKNFVNNNTSVKMYYNVITGKNITFKTTNK